MKAEKEARAEALRGPAPRTAARNFSEESSSISGLFLGCPGQNPARENGSTPLQYADFGGIRLTVHPLPWRTKPAPGPRALRCLRPRQISQEIPSISGLFRGPPGLSGPKNTGRFGTQLALHKARLRFASATLPCRDTSSAVRGELPRFLNSLRHSSPL